MIPNSFNEFKKKFVKTITPKLANTLPGKSGL